MTRILGNKCGHVPSAPRNAELPAHHKKRPDILEKVKVNLKTAYHAPAKSKYLKSLFFGHPKNRQMRSDGREAVKVLAEVFAHYVELATLKIGKVFPDGYFRPLSIEEIAAYANISIYRVKRALKKIVSAGYMEVQKRFTKISDDEFIGNFSERKLTYKFFHEIGIPFNMLELRRHWKRKREEKNKINLKKFSLPKSNIASHPVVNKPLFTDIDAKLEALKEKHAAILKTGIEPTKFLKQMILGGAGPPSVPTVKEKEVD
jgi:hypothetical protein